MNCHSLAKRALSLAVLILVLAMPALAQVQSGNIFGTVLNSADNQTLPGVTVTLKGAGAPLTQITDAQGVFRFPGLPPGSYDLAVEIQGFSPVEQTGVSVNIGRNTNVEVKLQPAIQGETVVVIDRSPLIDRHETGNKQTVTL